MTVSDNKGNWTGTKPGLEQNKTQHELKNQTKQRPENIQLKTYPRTIKIKA